MKVGADSGPWLVMRGIAKSFPGVQALQGVDLAVFPQFVTGLVGENGAGKSTLIKVLGGNLAPDAGEILVDGHPVAIDSPVVARNLGITVLHQELSLVRELSVAENVHLPHLPVRLAGWLDRRRMAETTTHLLRRLGLDLDPWTPVKRLTLAQQQLVEIARALSVRSRLIVMDEPTAALSEAETERLFQIVAELKESGTAVIFISHRMDEIFRLADEIVVLRDGRNAGTLRRAEADPDRVVRLMVGREVRDRFPKAEAPQGEALLDVSRLSVPGALEDVSFSLRRGETLGIGGLMGAGQYRLARALFGLERSATGRVTVKGRPARLSSPRAALRAGLGFLPENRKEDGLVPVASVGHNLALASLPRLTRMLGWMDRGRERQLVAGQMSSLAIKATGPGQPVKNLSGGNQQKVVLGRWLATEPEIIVMCEPTRGIDVGAKAEIYQLMGRLARSGKGLILISSELPELLAMSERVLVLNEGRVAGILKKDEATPERVMRLATGGVADAKE